MRKVYSYVRTREDQLIFSFERVGNHNNCPCFAAAEGTKWEGGGANSTRELLRAMPKLLPAWSSAFCSAAS